MYVIRNTHKVTWGPRRAELCKSCAGECKTKYKIHDSIMIIQSTKYKIHNSIMIIQNT